MTQTSAIDAGARVKESQGGALAGELRHLAHDLRNALNGVSVNLEVARTRATRGISDPEQLVPFLENAAQQLEAATKLHRRFADLAVTLAQDS